MFYWPLSCDMLLHTRCRGLAHWTFWSSLHAMFSVFQDNDWIQNHRLQLHKSKCFKLQGKLTIYTYSKTHKLQRQ